jgi:hypothetical protein
MGVTSHCVGGLSFVLDYGEYTECEGKPLQRLVRFLGVIYAFSIVLYFCFYITLFQYLREFARGILKHLFGPREFNIEPSLEHVFMKGSCLGS